MISPMTFLDTFSRASTSGWGQSDTGVVWRTTHNATFTVPTGQNYGLVTSGANVPMRLAYGDLSTIKVTKTTTDTIITRIMWESSLANPLTDFGPTLGVMDNSTFYFAAIQDNYSELIIGVYLKGTRRELAKVKNVALAKNKQYWMKFQRTATGLYLKIWEVGKIEPTAWRLTSGLYTGYGAPKAGNPGFFNRGAKDAYKVRIYDYGYRTSSAGYGATRVYDNFSRVVTNNWGTADTGQVWDGSHVTDPTSYAESPSISTSTSSGGYGLVTTNNVERNYMIGPNTPTDREINATIMMNTAADGLGKTRIGLRGVRGYVSGLFRPLGYMLQITTGTSELHIFERPGINATYTSIATGAASEIIQTGKQYRVRFQVKGSTMKAKVWAANASEPSGWQITVTDTTILSGAAWIGFANSTVSNRSFYVFSFESDTPAPDVTPENPNPDKNYTVLDRIDLMDVNDTSMSIRAFYREDVNNNSVLTLKYKESSKSTFTTVAANGYNRVSKYANFSISGLTKGKNYDIIVSVSDPDGAIGGDEMETVFGTTSFGLETGSAVVTNILPEQVTIEATYRSDLNASSTATLQSRKITQNTSLVEDYFNDAQAGQTLQNYNSSVGGEWIKHTISTGYADTMYRSNGFYTSTKYITDKVLYYHSITAPTDRYKVSGHFYLAGSQGNLGVAGRISVDSETYYAGGFNHDENVWELFKMVAGTKIVLGTHEMEFNGAETVTIQLDINEIQKSLYVNDTLMIEVEDNTITSGTRVGFYASNILEGTYNNQPILQIFSASYRTTESGWVSHGNMVANRSLNKFVGVATGLSPDTVYEFSVTYNDAQVYGVNPQLTVAMTPGKSSAFRFIGAITSYSSAVVAAKVDYDTNRNSTLSYRYRAVSDLIWTTVGFDKVVKYRDQGRFELTIANLRPSTTYEVEVILTDPDGLLEGTPSRIRGLFTTKGYLTNEVTHEKYYIWKIYNRKGGYLGTIHDAPQPEFSIHENGGVTDLGVPLYRKFSEMDADNLIGFQHRIDVWALDPSSNGMGPNLISDPDHNEGGWVIGETSGDIGRNSVIDPTGGPDGGKALKISSSVATEWPQASNPILIRDSVPLVVSCVARATGSKLRMYVRAFDASDQGFDTSDDQAETVGPDWQKISLTYTPPPNTRYIRVYVENDNKGTMWADKFEVRAKEIKVYSGFIESYTPRIDANGESVAVQVLGLASFLSDDYIEFLQFVENQPQKDALAGRLNRGAADPADMLKYVIDEGRKSNPLFPLYYTEESIKYTGQLMQYTFRDQQLRHCMDKIRDLCPAGWYYYIDADGLVYLQGPQHATTHYLRIGVEVSSFEVEKSIRNLKNYIRVKGRQDADMSEPGAEGSIHYVTFDQESIDRYGKRVSIINDSQIIDHESARIIGDGRLEENNKEEQRAKCIVPDEKLLRHSTGSLKGYNIEAFKPGDKVIITDPESGTRYSYWNKMAWAEDAWDINEVFHPVPEGVPIKTISYKSDEVHLELSERPPSQVGDYAKLYRWMSLKDKE